MNTGFTLLLVLLNEPFKDSRFNLAEAPIHGWKWSIILWILAFHTIVAVILTELMGRTYGKPWLWFILAFCLPIIGPVTILLYHLILASATLDARKQTFWHRLLFSGPVSLQRVMAIEKQRQYKVELSEVKTDCRKVKTNGADADIDALLKARKYSDARACAWKMMDIAREMRNSAKERIYLDYLELIAETESLDSGEDINSD